MRARAIGQSVFREGKALVPMAFSLEPPLLRVDPNYIVSY